MSKHRDIHETRTVPTSVAVFLFALTGWGVALANLPWT